MEVPESVGGELRRGRRSGNVDGGLGLVFAALRGRIWLGDRCSSSCVSGLRPRRGASRRGRLLGGCSPLPGSFANWSTRSRHCVLPRKQHWTGGGGGLLFRFVPSLDD